MSTSKKTAIIVGVLFIVATVSSSLGFMLRDPILDDPEYLFQVSANETQVLIGVLLVLIDCVAVVAIPATLYPILKKHSVSCCLLPQTNANSATTLFGNHLDPVHPQQSFARHIR